jgi:hypothetical protein
MKWIDLKVGDDAWIFLSHHKGKKSKGEVKMIIDVPGWSFSHYVIEIPTHVDNLLEIRCGFSVSDTEDGTLGYMRR